MVEFYINFRHNKVKKKYQIGKPSLISYNKNFNKLIKWLNHKVNK